MLLTILYIIGITAEAISGALAAGRNKMDLFGVIVIALVSAIGGGSVRDILLGNYPLSWVKNPEYIIIISIAAIITMFLAPLINYLYKIFLLLDAIGLVVFSIIGVQVALNAQHASIISAIAAVITGVFGGILRDMFCNRIPLIFQQELYAGIAFISAWIYILLLKTHLTKNLIVIITLFFGLSARLLAIYFRLKLPVFNYSYNQKSYHKK
ncbi:trimeric intracellular cation channel family protein [Pantoea sp. Aalb]|uniref:trimeric intracellular cation channel family protein n=1 Tax=Pantoea sp. Aalb TaxID=2576762 RepID=UPI0013240886|nr:trimeric intracellular cation channel family protein [Pantoea sp. Aalb]MXP67951.1 trimeric intracellular cation channel family protein [Pantoea sp. Aalb]